MQIQINNGWNQTTCTGWLGAPYYENVKLKAFYEPVRND